MAKQAIELLARHELYAARFYYDRDHPEAAAGRLHTLLRAYPGNRYEAEALHLLAETYLELHDRPRARRALQELIARHPGDDYAESARDALADLGS
jgi:outer membrane protein assembly factor BamD